MKLLSNILWMIFGGFISSILWLLAGCFWCITIIGIPLGKQCFKLARLTLCPFGKKVKYKGGTVSTIANVFWVILTGLPMAIENAICGVILCCTIIGIPFGKQFFKLAKLSFSPFGMELQ